MPPPRCRRVEQRLDLLLGGVGQLAAVLVEELDAVVLRRVVRCRDDDAEVEREQRHRRRRQHPGEHGVAARGDDAARERLLELGTRAAGVTADEDATAAGPERRGLAEPLDELDGQILADDAPDAVGPEVPLTSLAPRPPPGRAAPPPRSPPSNSGGGASRDYRLENCGALRALWRPAFLRSTTRASRVRNPSRLSGTRSSGSASTRARAIPCRTAPAWPDGPPPWTRTRMSNVPSTPAVFSGASAVVRCVARGKVVLERAAVEPRLPVARTQDDARDRGLALAGAEILRLFRHYETSNVFGA